MASDSPYQRLSAAASLEGDDAAIRVRATYEPGAGPGAKVSPPTYPLDGRGTPYLFETRRTTDRTREVVLLDSRQSQANRCEEALQDAIDDGLGIPHLVLDVQTHDRTIRLTSLTVPHRSRDAYFRDAEAEDGTRFDDTPAGRALAAAQPGDATALYRHAPTDLVYGVWDSHRDLRQAQKFPRVYTSELIGWDPERGRRAAGRYDLLTGGTKISGGNKDWSQNAKGGTRISEIGLGPIPPSDAPGGVTVSSIERLATLSFA